MLLIVASTIGNPVSLITCLPSRRRMHRPSSEASPCAEQFMQRAVDEWRVFGVPQSHVTPDRRYRPAPGARDAARLVLAVDRREVAVVLAGQDDGARFDRAEGAVEVTLVGRAVADIAVMPCS